MVKVCALILVALLSGCAKVTHEVVGEPDVHYYAEPVVIIVTGNIPVTLPSGNYTISGNELVIKELK